MNRRCPKCGSSQIEVYEDLAFIKCHNCGYDELKSEPFPYDSKKSLRERARFGPYPENDGRGITKK